MADANYLIKLLRDNFDDQFTKAMGFAGAGVTGGASKVVANNFAKFGKEVPLEGGAVASDIAKHTSTGVATTTLGKGTKLGKLKSALEKEAKAKAADTAAKTKAHNAAVKTNAEESLATFKQQRPTMEQLLAKEESVPIAPLPTEPAMTFGTGALAATTIAGGAALASDIPVSPEARIKKAVDTHLNTPPATESVAAPKENRDIINADAQVTGTAEIVQDVKNEMAVADKAKKSKEPPKFSSKDIIPVIVDPRPGQTIYKFTVTKALDLGYDSPKGVFFNLPNDRIDGEALDRLTNSSKGSVSVISRKMTVDSKAPEIKDNYDKLDAMRTAMMQDRMESDTALASLIDLRSQVSDLPDSLTKANTLASVETRIAQAKNRINQEVTVAMQADPEAQRTYNDIRVAESERPTPQARSLMNTLRQATAMPESVIAAYSTGRTAATTEQWAIDYQLKGTPSYIDTKSLTSYGSLTQQTLKKQAMQIDKKSEESVHAELQALSMARQNALNLQMERNTDAEGKPVDKVIPAGLTAAGAPKNSAQFLKDFSASAKTMVGQVLINEVLQKEFGTVHLDGVKAVLQERNLKDPEARNVLQSVLSTIEGG